MLRGKSKEILILQNRGWMIFVCIFILELSQEFVVKQNPSFLDHEC